MRTSDGWQAKDADQAFGDSRLKEWKQYVAGPSYENGWPDTSVAYRLAQAKELGVGTRGTAVRSIPDSVVATDQAVGELKTAERALWRVLTAYYLSSQPIPVKCRHLHVEERTFYRMANRAKGWIGSRARELDADRKVAVSGPEARATRARRSWAQTLTLGQATEDAAED